MMFNLDPQPKCARPYDHENPAGTRSKIWWENPIDGAIQRRADCPKGSLRRGPSWQRC